MPKCGSQVPLCDVPIRFDTYIGCTHGCTYCFVKRLSDINDIKVGESINSLRSFINGKRDKATAWCDWDIPIHWGGMSDPFQPCERKHLLSLKALELFRETQYPFIVSTKSTLIAESPWYDVLKETKNVTQISMVCERYDEYERGVADYDSRLKMLPKLSEASKRLIIRIQPYLPEVEKDVIINLQKLKDAGAYGIILEGMKYRTKRADTVKFYGDNVIKKDILASSFRRIRDKAHDIGLVFLSGENRLRSMGDSLTCCGCEGLDGFNINRLNINSYNLGREYIPTESQKTIGTGSVFNVLCQGMETKYGLALKKQSFNDAMERYYRAHKDIVS